MQRTDLETVGRVHAPVCLMTRKTPMRIGVFIPVYREPKLLNDLLSKLTKDTYPCKEIVVAVDGELTPPIQQALESFKETVRVFYPRRHWGKAKLLNEVVACLEADLLVFLDNDILLPDDPHYLEKIKDRAEHYDIIEMAKEVIPDSLFSSMIGYEYLGFAFVHFLFYKLSRRLPSVIGSAFAVKRTLFEALGGFRLVVHEDVDFGARAFRLDARYSFERSLKVKTAMPGTLKGWVQQRKRWTLINILWFQENLFHIVKNMIKQPKLLSAFLLSVVPLLFTYAVFLFFQHSNLYYHISLPLILANYSFFTSGAFLWFAHYSMIAQGVVGALLSFSLSAGLQFAFSRYFRFRFHILEYSLYYFFYMPVIFVFHIGMFFYMMATGKLVPLQWKVSES